MVGVSYIFIFKILRNYFTMNKVSKWYVKRNFSAIKTEHGIFKYAFVYL